MCNQLEVPKELAVKSQPWCPVRLKMSPRGFSDDPIRERGLSK